jgi:acyl-CoA synthetase (AMP-forming)/AMP-acid ligase II
MRPTLGCTKRRVNAQLVTKTLAHLIDKTGGRLAAVWADEGGRRVSYDEFAADVNALAGKLSASGIRHGDRVAIVLPNGPQFIRFLLAVTAIGAAAAPLNPMYTETEFAYYFDDLGPRVVLLPSGQIAAARKAAGSRHVIDVDSDAFVGRKSMPYEGATPDDVALVLLTSGTTNRPKQVPLLHRNLVASAESIADFYQLSAADVSYCVMPLFHVHGLVASVLATLASRGTAVVPTRFAPRRFLGHVRDHDVTWFSASPTPHAMILDRGVQDALRTSLRFVRSCSSALSPELLHRCEDAYGAPVLEAYGMTEASHQVTSNPLPPLQRQIGSVGIASGSAEVRVVDADGVDVSVGEVVVRGPAVTPGYVANPEANAVAFFDGGWFRTGDRGHLDLSGYVYLEGRIKELIIRGGENISPQEIETVLMGHPAVSDAAAFGVEDSKYGEEVAVAVALTGQATERDLRDWCRERLAPFKVPTVIFFIERIPRTVTGKLQRRRLAEQLTRKP